ncbi:MAG: heme-binding beta-barrel domain-containing protein [Oligoflexales bacterium]
MNIIQEQLGPLSYLVGTWEGVKGEDVAPSDVKNNLNQPVNSKFRERMQFAETGRVDNHEQTLYGLRYSTTAWRANQDAPFHEELGYWLWDRAKQQVLRCFMVPRGVTAIAGGTVSPLAKTFKLSAELGSPTYGICSNQYLHDEFKTLRYDLDITIHGEDSFSYDENTQIMIKGKSDIFQHTDSNTLSKLPSGE